MDHLCSANTNSGDGEDEDDGEESCRVRGDTCEDRGWEGACRETLW